MFVVGRAGALYTEAVSSPQRPQVRFHLWPFAACHFLSLSLPYFLSTHQLSYLRNKDTKSPKNIFKNKDTLNVKEMI